MLLPCFFRSIRFRLAVWNSLAVALVAIAALFGLRQSIRWTLNHEINQILLEDGNEVRLVLKELGPLGLDAVADELRRKATGHAHHRWFIRLLDSSNAVVWSSELASESPFAPGVEPLQTRGQSRIHRLAATPNPLGVDTIQLGASLVPLRNALQRIDRIVIGTSVLLLLFSPCCGYWLSALAIRDLAAMTATAARLQPSQLDERLQERGVDDELDRLAQTINNLLDKIAEFVEEKRSFLADAAHELRTPLAAIRSSAEVGLAHDRSEEEYREIIEQLIADSDSLEVLVNQVLLLSEALASRGEFPKAEVELSEVANRSVEMFRGVAESRAITLHVTIEPGIVVRGVHPHLAQVVNNLLDNALKYTSEGGRVALHLQRSPSGDAVLTIEDTGIGIDPDDVPRVFNRFFRADRSRQRNGVGGSGLGLSICQSIVAAHDGSIHCSSMPGKGTRFEVHMPRIV